MRRALTLHSKTLKHFTSNLKPIQSSSISDNLKPNNHIIVSPNPLSSSPYTLNLRFFSSSSENDSSNQTNEPKSESTEPKTEPTEPETEPTESKSEPIESKSDPTEATGIEDVSIKDLKLQLEEYFNEGNEGVLPTIFESILKRKLDGKNEDTDNEIVDKFDFKPLGDVRDQDFEDDLEEFGQDQSVDDEIEDLSTAGDIVTKRMMDDPYFNMNEHKWDDMVQEAVDLGYMKDPKEIEDQIEDLRKWDTLLPDHAKQEIENKLDEIEGMIERKELTPDEGYELFKKFEDELVNQVTGQEEAAQQSDRPDERKDQDPPGEGPILRWQSRVVFCPGGDAWHPRNRKVKMAVTVKELGLSKHQQLRLRALVQKRYNSGKDELTIISERFEHREENRKDCLRTLYALVDEARKADVLVDDARTKYVKEKLKSNPEFMEKLHAKVLRAREISA